MHHGIWLLYGVFLDGAQVMAHLVLSGAIV